MRPVTAKRARNEPRKRQHWPDRQLKKEIPLPPNGQAPARVRCTTTSASAGHVLPRPLHCASNGAEQSDRRATTSAGTAARYRQTGQALGRVLRPSASARIRERPQSHMPTSATHHQRQRWPPHAAHKAFPLAARLLLTLLLLPLPLLLLLLNLPAAAQPKAA